MTRSLKVYGGMKSDSKGIFRVSGNLYTVEKKQETIEASQLGIAVGHVPDKIEVRTTRTGRRLMYEATGQLRDREHELLYTEYTCKEYGFKLTVLND